MTQEAAAGEQTRYARPAARYEGTYDVSGHTNAVHSTYLTQVVTRQRVGQASSLFRSGTVSNMSADLTDTFEHYDQVCSVFKAAGPCHGDNAGGKAIRRQLKAIGEPLHEANRLYVSVAPDLKRAARAPLRKPLDRITMFLLWAEPWVAT